MTTDHLSPHQAAKLIGVSRSTIMRALADKSLFAGRDNRNRWLIDLDALKRWADDRENNQDWSRTVLTADQDMSSELAAAKVEIRLLREQLDDIRADRDAWREQTDRLTSNSRSSRPSIIDRIFRTK